MASITKVGNSLRAKLEQKILSDADELCQIIKNNTPVVTGRLRDAWQVEQQSNSVSVVNRTPYSVFVEFGTAKMAPRSMMRSGVQEWASKKR